jgi:hypothetical protein
MKRVRTKKSEQGRILIPVKRFNPGTPPVTPKTDHSKGVRKIKGPFLPPCCDQFQVAQEGYRN